MLLLLWLLACVLFMIQSFLIFFGDIYKAFHYWLDYTEIVDSSLLVCPIHDSVLNL